MLKLIIKPKNKTKKILKSNQTKFSRKNKVKGGNKVGGRNEVKSKNKVKEIIVSKKISDEKISSLEGKYLSDKYFDVIIRNDADIFYFQDKKKYCWQNLEKCLT